MKKVFNFEESMGNVKYTISQMQNVAKKRKGRCLSKEYINARLRLTWQCKKGHTWDMHPDIIMNGGWCPVCLEHYYLEEVSEIAESRGGKCLSVEYINNHTDMRWKCHLGHEWKACANNIKNGTWCPTCRKATLNDMQQIAEKKGGKCLSSKYINSHVHLQWQCKEGHIWKALPSAIKQGQWCKRCLIKRIADMKRDTIEHMLLIAISRGGKCLSTEYVHGQIKLKWECKLGHQWNAVPGPIKQGTWCPVCWKERSKNVFKSWRLSKVKV